MLKICGIVSKIIILPRSAHLYVGSGRGRANSQLHPTVAGEQEKKKEEAFKFAKDRDEAAYGVEILWEVKKSG